MLKKGFHSTRPPQARRDAPPPEQGHKKFGRQAVRWAYVEASGRMRTKIGKERVLALGVERVNRAFFSILLRVAIFAEPLDRLPQCDFGGRLG